MDKYITIIKEEKKK